MYKTSQPTNKSLYIYKHGPGLDYKEKFSKFQKNSTITGYILWQQYNKANKKYLTKKKC